MIIQGTNISMTFEFPISVSNIMDMEISLFSASGEELKRWSVESEYINENRSLSVGEDGMKVYAPLTQDETANFPAGECLIEIKWLTEKGETMFASPIQETIVSRRDRGSYLDEDGQGWVTVVDSSNGSSDTTGGTTE